MSCFKTPKECYADLTICVPQPTFFSTLNVIFFDLLTHKLFWPTILTLYFFHQLPNTLLVKWCLYVVIGNELKFNCSPSVRTCLHLIIGRIKAWECCGSALGSSTGCYCMWGPKTGWDTEQILNQSSEAECASPLSPSHSCPLSYLELFLVATGFRALHFCPAYSSLAWHTYPCLWLEQVSLSLRCFCLCCADLWPSRRPQGKANSGIFWTGF